MKAIADKANLVLAGAFNPAILSPQWIAIHGLGHPPGQEFQVELLAPIGGAGQQRFSFDGLSYTAEFRKLTLHLDLFKVEQSERAAGAAANVLQRLPHTPVVGLGFNFAFLVEEPSAGFMALMTTHDALTDSFDGEPEVVLRKWGNTVKWNAALVGVECELAGGQATIGFNFHYATATAGEAEAILRSEHVFNRHRDRAIAAASALSGQHLEEQDVN